jgi:hypothetical protein
MTSYIFICVKPLRRIFFFKFLSNIFVKIIVCRWSDNVFYRETSNKNAGFINRGLCLTSFLKELPQQNPLSAVVDRPALTTVLATFPWYHDNRGYQQCQVKWKKAWEIRFSCRFHRNCIALESCRNWDAWESMDDRFIINASTCIRCCEGQ